MIVRVTDDAADDLQGIKAFIEERDAAAADRVMEQIRRSIEMLGQWPRVGHDGIVPGTYDKAVPRTPFVIVYRIDHGDREEELVILRVPHAAQDRSTFT